MKAFIALGSLIVVALLVLLVGPIFVDWTAYRTQFEAEASRLLGQRVEVRGKASARLLPFPSVTFDDVVVGDPADPVLTMRSFRMDAELAPYLSGEIRIFDMRLDAPRLSVPIEADGSVRWPISTEALGGGSGIVLERVAISDGSAVLEDRRMGQALRLSDVEAQLSASSLAGPFAGTATLLANGEPLGLTLSTGLATADATLPVRLTAQSARANLTGSLDAVLSSGDGRPLIDGRLQVVSPLLTPADAQADPGDPPPFRADARIEVASDAASLQDMRIEVGAVGEPYVVEGAARLALGSIPHFDLTLTGQAVDVDELAPAPASSATLADRVAGLRTLIDRVPRPTIPGRVQLSLPIVTIGDTDLRQVSFAGSPTGGGWSIETLTAELPGRSRLEVSGIARLAGTPSFAGSLLLAVRQPAAFFTWAGLGEASDLVRLSRAGFSAQVDLSALTQRFDALELDLDGSVLSGSVLRTVRPEGTSNDIELSGGRIDLAPLSVLLAPAGTRAVAETERFDVQFDAGPVRWGSYEAGHLSADFTLVDGMLDIADANADDLAGASVHATGTVADLFGAPRPDLAVDLVADTPDRLLALAADVWPQSPLLAALQARSATLRPATLAGTLASPPGAQTRDLLVALSGTVGGTRTDVRLALENGLAARSLNGRFGLDAVLENADAAALLAQLGRPVLALDGLPPLRVALNVSGSPSEPVAGNLAIVSQDARLTGDGTVRLGIDGIEALDGRMALRAENLTPWLTTLGVSAGQPIEGLPVDLAASLNWSRARWDLADLSGRLADARVSANLIGVADEPVRGTIQGSTVSAAWLQSLLLGRDDVGLDTRFGAGLLAGRSFEIAARSDQLELGTTEVRDLQMRLASDGSQLRIDELSALVDTHPFTADGTLRNVDGVVTLEAGADLDGWPVPDNDLLSGRADIALRATGGGRTPREILRSLAGSGRVRLVDGAIKGMSADALAPVIVAADNQVEALDLDTVARLLRETGEGAAFPLASLDVPFRLGAGALTTDPVSATQPGAELTADAALGLGSGALAGTIALHPVTSEVAEAEPPRIDYRLAGTLRDPALEVRPEALVGWLGVRAYQREQERVEALREELAETARLRREARLYRERASLRDMLRADRIAREDAERERLEAARRDAERREREAAEALIERPPAPATPDLSAPIPTTPTPPVSPSVVNGLPGVRVPERF